MKNSILIFLLFFIFYFSVVIIFIPTPFHSEGMMMVSDIGEKIAGIDFEKKEFLKPARREKKILPFISIVKQDFFPYLKIKVSRFEIPVIWKEYHGAIFTYFTRSFGEKILFLPYSFRVRISAFMYFFFLGFVSFFFLIKIAEDYLFLNKSVVLLLLFSLLSVSTFYFFMTQFHHLQAGMFLLATVYFMKKRRYVLGSLSAGLTLFSYLPMVFAISSIFLTSLIYHRELKKILLAFALALIFSLPHIYYIISSQGEDFKAIYKCSDCVVLFPPGGLKFHLGKAYPIDFKRFGEIFLYFITSALFFPLRIESVSVEIIRNIKESFSLSDVLIRYGHITGTPPLKEISDFAIFFSLFLIFFGTLYLRGFFELVFALLSALFFTILANYFPIVPKMLYMLLPIWGLITTRIIVRFIEWRIHFFLVLILIFSFLRVIDIWKIKDYFPGRLSVKDNYEIIKFFEDRNIKDTDILIYAFPPAFKIYSDGKLNPAVFLPIFEKIEPDIRERTIEFIINEGKWKYVVFDSSFEKFLSNMIEKRKLKAKLQILMKNNGYIIAKIER